MFDLHHLHQFVAVAEERHFGRAAKRLHMAQPPLSQAIKRLEDRMGVVLLERTTRKVALTPAGETLLTEARVLLAHAKRTTRLTRQAAEGFEGRIAIGFVSAALYQLLPKTLRAFRKQFPDADLALRELTTEQQLAALQDGSIDVGFCHPPLAGKSDLTVRTIARDRLLAALPKDHPLTQKKKLDFASLACQPFVLFPARQGPSLHAAIERACYRFGARLSIVAEASRIHTQLSLVAGGLGVTLVPVSARNIRVEGVSYRPIRDLPEGLFLETALLFYPSEKRALLDAFLAIADARTPEHRRMV